MDGIAEQQWAEWVSLLNAFLGEDFEGSMEKDRWLGVSRMTESIYLRQTRENGLQHIESVNAVKSIAEF